MKSLNKLIRATYDDDTITVYQSFNETIAKKAVREQTFVSPPFKIERMTWIKPSFLWMMYRSGYANKKNQEYTLAIKIKREKFDEALKNSCLSRFDDIIYNNLESWKMKMKSSDVRIQWDPERDILLNSLSNTKSIQIGITGETVIKYINDWIVKIEDVTHLVKEIESNIKKNELDKAIKLLPPEDIYPLNKVVSQIIGASYYN